MKGGMYGEQFERTVLEESVGTVESSIEQADEQAPQRALESRLAVSDAEQEGEKRESHSTATGRGDESGDIESMLLA